MPSRRRKAEKRSRLGWLYVSEESLFSSRQRSEGQKETFANSVCSQVIRGNSVVMLEALERIGGDDRQHR